MTVNEIVQGIFGYVRNLSRGYTSSHDGLDIPAPEGTPVYALASGVISYARDARTQADKGARGWAIAGGNVVNIDIGNSLRTQYAHLSSIAVREGQTVQKGDLIGYVGKTGGTNAGVPGGAGSQFVGSHLHFGLWDLVSNKMVNPTMSNIPSGGTSTPVTPGVSDGNVSNTTVDHLKALQDRLRAIGISSDPTHKFTYEEGLKIANEIYNVKGDIANSIALDWKDKTVQERANLAASGQASNVNIFSDVQNSLPDIDVGAALMFIAVILVGITFMAIGGIITLRKK